MRPAEWVLVGVAAFIADHVAAALSDAQLDRDELTRRIIIGVELVIVFLLALQWRLWI